MKKSGKKLLVLAATLLALQGCSETKDERKVDEKLAVETTVTRTELSIEAADLISSYPGLNEQQRAQLTELRKSTRQKLDAVQAESVKLRSVLIGEVFSSKYNAAEVQSVKDRLKKIEEQRLSLIFNSIDQANKIFGRKDMNQERRDKFSREFFDSRPFRE